MKCPFWWGHWCFTSGSPVDHQVPFQAFMANSRSSSPKAEHKAWFTAPFERRKEMLDQCWMKELSTEYLFNDEYILCVHLIYSNIHDYKYYNIWLYMCLSQTVNGWHAHEDIPNHSGYQLEARPSGSIDVHWMRCDWAKHRIHVCSGAPQTSPRTHGDRITASSAAGIELWMHLLLQNVMVRTAKYVSKCAYIL